MNPTAMTHLMAGNQLFHNGVPVQLLYRVAHSTGSETWRIRTLLLRRPIGRIDSLHRTESRSCTP